MKGNISMNNVERFVKEVGHKKGWLGSQQIYEICDVLVELRNGVKEILRKLNDSHADNITNKENWKEINELIDKL